MENKEIIKEALEQAVAVFDSLHSEYCAEEAIHEYDKWVSNKIDELNIKNRNGSKFQTICLAFSGYVAINSTKSSLIRLKDEFISSGEFDKVFNKIENTVSFLDKLFGTLEKSLKEEKEEEKKEITVEKLQNEEEKATLKNIIYQIYLKQDEGEKFNISILAKEQMKELKSESKKRISSILVNLGSQLRTIDSFDKASSIVEEYCK